MISPTLRFAVFRRDAFKCSYCGRRSPDVVLHVDHIIPVAKGGPDDVMNLVTACVDCNRGKADKNLLKKITRENNIKRRKLYKPMSPTPMMTITQRRLAWLKNNNLTITSFGMNVRLCYVTVSKWFKPNSKGGDCIPRDPYLNKVKFVYPTFPH